MNEPYIGGAWAPAASGATSQTLNPYDATVLDTLAEAGAADVDAAVAAAREAFDQGPWRRSTMTDRTALLGKIADLLQRDREQLAHTESLDTGKTLNEARADVDDTTAVFRYYAGMAGEHAGRVVDPGRPGVVSRIVHEPVGVCALIAPWNYPLLQISWKLAPALAAGNTTVIKPSELTPLSTVALVGLFEEADIPPGVLNLLLGQGGTAGQALVAHGGVDLISFTGGLATGEKIMASAAQGVRRVALELGGKNPNIVFDGTDFDTVVDNALTAAFLHSGQVCSAGARLIVQDSLHDSFVHELAARADRIRLGSGAGHGHRVRAADLRGAPGQGGTAHRGRRGRRRAPRRRREPGGAPELAGGFFLRPTVFDGCTRDMAIVREEVFGPVVTVERFTTEEEAVRLGNDTDYGLAGAVWTGNAGGPSASRARCATAPSGSTTTIPTSRRRNGAASASRGSAASSARPASRSTRKRSTSITGSTRSPALVLGRTMDEHGRLRLHHRRRRLRRERPGQPLVGRPGQQGPGARGPAGLPLGHVWHRHARRADVPHRQPLLRLGLPVGAGAEPRQPADLSRGGKLLGGSSSINGMIFQRGSPLDYERWAADPGMEAWDYRHCLPYFKRMENSLAGDEEYRGHEGLVVLEREAGGQRALPGLLRRGGAGGLPADR